MKDEQDDDIDLDNDNLANHGGNLEKNNNLEKTGNNDKEVEKYNEILSNKTEPSETELTETHSNKASPSETDLTETEPTKTEPTKTEPTKTEPTKTEPTKTKSSKMINDEKTKNDVEINDNQESLEKVETNSLEEINLEVSENGSEILKLKKPKEVYIDIYKKALKRARDIKKQAINEFLNAKKIKNTYLLDDLEISDDEDLETFS